MESSEAHDVGRPSKLAQYAPQIAQWLREDPAPSAVEILRRVRLAGYRGGKSALYELVRRVRPRRRPDDRPEGVRQLVIVAGNREHLYNFFKRAFAENETVRVLLDRRVAERRQHSEPHESERRRGKRRSPDTIDGLLRVIGWTIVRVSALKNRRGSAC